MELICDAGGGSGNNCVIQSHAEDGKAKAHDGERKFQAGNGAAMVPRLCAPDCSSSFAFRAFMSVLAGLSTYSFVLLGRSLVEGASTSRGTIFSIVESDGSRSKGRKQSVTRSKG